MAKICIFKKPLKNEYNNMWHMLIFVKSKNNCFFIIFPTHFWNFFQILPCTVTIKVRSLFFWEINSKGKIRGGGVSCMMKFALKLKYLNKNIIFVVLSLWCSSARKFHSALETKILPFCIRITTNYLDLIGRFAYLRPLYKFIMRSN